MNENLSPKEKYELTKEEKQVTKSKQSNDALGSIVKKVVGAIVIIAVIVLAIWLLAKEGERIANNPTDICIQHANLAMHIHPHISIRIHGEQQPITANIGLSEDCMRPLHTHDATGLIHVEFPTRRDPALSEFFTVWGKHFGSEGIFEYRNGSEGKVKMLVNGVPNDQFENYIMQDGDQIEIIFEKVEDEDLAN